MDFRKTGLYGEMAVSPIFMREIHNLFVKWQTRTINHKKGEKRWFFYFHFWQGRDWHIYPARCFRQKK